MKQIAQPVVISLFFNIEYWEISIFVRLLILGSFVKQCYQKYPWDIVNSFLLNRRGIHLVEWWDKLGQLQKQLQVIASKYKGLFAQIAPNSINSFLIIEVI